MTRFSYVFAIFGCIALGGMTACKPQPKKPGTCKTKADCKAGEQCLNGKCVQCVRDKDCGPGKRCVNGACQQKPGYCRTNKDCPDGKACIDHLCKACTIDKECGNGTCIKGRCKDAGSGACKEDDDCKDEEVCKNNRCVPAPKPYTGPTLCKLQNVSFEFNKAQIRQTDIKRLEANARCIQKVTARKVHLNGHCDPRGTEEYNLALSNRRAQAVKRYLETLGVPAARLHVVPKGELEATGTNEASWAKDRKVEFIWY